MDKNLEKPANKWRREDFADILRVSPRLRKLTTQELCVFFLQFAEVIGTTAYYKRINMEEARMQTARMMQDHRPIREQNAKVKRLYRIWGKHCPTIPPLWRGRRPSSWCMMRK